MTSASEPTTQGWSAVLAAVALAVAAAAWLIGAAVAGYVLVAAMAVLALARGRLPAERIGPLVVRSRLADVTVMLGFAAVLLATTILLPAG